MQGLSSVSLLLLYYSSIGPLVVGVFHASATGDLALPARVPAPLAFDDAPLAAIQFRHQAPSRQRPAIPAPVCPQARSSAPLRPIPIPLPRIGSRVELPASEALRHHVCARLVDGNIHWPVCRLHQALGDQVGLDFGAAHVRQHVVVDLNARA
jgi:hypothetical protein